MTFGLRIVNDDDELIIDSEYFSPAFVTKLEFSSTLQNEEAGSTYLHPGYIKRDYITASPAPSTAGNYIVLWRIPDNFAFYVFPSSTVNMGGYLSCSVMIPNGNTLSYNLPTAYLFSLDTLPNSSGYGLQLFNGGSPNLKTFDSNNLQLAPYSITDETSFWSSPSPTSNNFTYTGTFIYRSADGTISGYTPPYPIFLIPDYRSLVVTTTSSTHIESMYQPGFRSIGGFSLEIREFLNYYSQEDSPWPYSQLVTNSGNREGLSVLAADGGVLYGIPNPPIVGAGTTPTYSLEFFGPSQWSEGSPYSLMLTTTNVAAGTVFPYTITGISAADLDSGSLTGNFVVPPLQGGVGYSVVTFSIKKDYILEGTEYMSISINNMPDLFINNIPIADVYIGTPTYAFSTPSPVNENSTGFINFTGTNAVTENVTFAIIAPTSGTPATINGADGTLSTTFHQFTSNAATTIPINFIIANDGVTEGPEYFRVQASVNGTPVATSQNITINDTSQTPSSSLSSLDVWTENGNYTVTLNAVNLLGSTIYLTPTTGKIELLDPPNSVYINSNNFVKEWTYYVYLLDTNTTETINARLGSNTGTPIASKTVSLINAPAFYFWSDTGSINEGATSSTTFNFGNSLNQTITFSVVAPSSGLNGSGDVNLITTSHTPSSNGTGAVSVSYSVSADSLTEGTEYFRLLATVNGNTYTSSNIAINDTSTTPVTPGYSITALNTPWAESATQYASITVTNLAGEYINLSTNSGYVTPNVADIYIPNNSYTTNVAYDVGDLPSTTNVTLFLNYYGVKASAVVSVIHTPPVPTYGIYNTWSSLANGAGAYFYLRSSNANGVNVTVSKSGAGASRVTIDPTNFTINTNSTTDTYILVTASIPTVATPAQSVTISLSTGQSFSFTIPAYTLVAPLVSSVTYAYGQTYYSTGEVITAIINFNGPITAGMYIRVELNAGLYGIGNNVFQSGITYDNGDFPLGATSGYYISPANPGIYNTTARVGARCENSDGSIRQNYVYGGYVTLGTGAPP
jgi:hypothetical protein